jgi:hypothetical protein
MRARQKLKDVTEESKRMNVIKMRRPKRKKIEERERFTRERGEERRRWHW